MSLREVVVVVVVVILAVTLRAQSATTNLKHVCI